MTEEIRGRIARMTVPERGSTVRQAMQAIDAGALGLALLAEAETGRFAGLVTDGDVRRALLSGVGMEAPVEAIARPAAKTARTGTGLDEIAAMFSEPVRVVPLLDAAERVVDLAVFDRRVHLPVMAPSLGERELQYVSECILTGWISSAGRFVREFEERFADFSGTAHAVSASNGTVALHLALLGLGIGPGDEVIVPTLSFIATANAVRYVGATPVFVDSDRVSWNLDPAQVEDAVTARTRAIIPVHLYGHPADMDPIRETAREHGLAVVEDAAEAHGARYRGRVVGGLGDVAAFSFYGNKIITTGEGGMLTTDDPELAARMRVLRDHGMSPDERYLHPVLGYNYRLTNLQAAVGVAQMEKVERILAHKRRVAALYAEALAEIPGVLLPPRAPWAESVFWLYSILIDAGAFGRTRDEVMRALAERGVETRPLFRPIHQQPIYESGLHLPVAEELAATGLSLPSSVGLRDEDVQRVVDSLRALAR